MAAGSEGQLADGRAVVLRLAGSADVPAIARLYQDLSPESFQRRFHGGRLAPSLLARLASLEISVTGGMPGWPAGSTGRRVLVERRGWFDDPQVAALRSAGNDVRQCPGPLRQVRACPLVSSGRCRLAEQADLVVSLLPADEPDCAAVLAAHRRCWPHRLAQL